MTTRTRSVVWFLTLLIVCVIGLGVAYLPREREAPSERLPQTVVLPRPAPQAQTSEVFKDLLAAFRDAPAGSDRVANLVAVLKAHKDDPAARDFLAEFNRSPELRELWKGGAEGGNADEPEESRMRRIAGSRAFLDLLNKRSGDPRFAALAAAMAQELRARNAKPADSIGMVVKEDSRRPPPAAKQRKFDAARLAGGGAGSKDLSSQGKTGPHPTTGFTGGVAPPSGDSSGPPSSGVSQTSTSGSSETGPSRSHEQESQGDRLAKQRVLEHLVRHLEAACSGHSTALDCAQAKDICRSDPDCGAALDRAAAARASSNANTSNNSGGSSGGLRVCITPFGPIPCSNSHGLPSVKLP